MIKLIYDQAVAKLTNQKDNLDQLIKETTGSEIGDFIQRVLSWYHDKNKIHLLWEIFNKVFDLNPVLFMDTFHGFVVNCLLDDSAFRVEYRKLLIDDNHNLVWENNEHKTVLSSKDDPDSDPVVIWDNNGTQKVSLLMDAMDHAELRDLRRHQQNEKIKEMFSKIRS